MSCGSSGNTGHVWTGSGTKVLSVFRTVIAYYMGTADHNEQAIGDQDSGGIKSVGELNQGAYNEVA